MRAFHGKQEVKDFYLARVRAHRAADQLVKGQYWDKDEDGIFRGCALGCTLHTGNHLAYEDELGIPQALARLEDWIFERLPTQAALAWPEAFLMAIAPGADLSRVADAFIVWLLETVLIPACSYAKRAQLLEEVSAFYRRRTTGEVLSEEEWERAKQRAGNLYEFAFSTHSEPFRYYVSLAANIATYAANVYANAAGDVRESTKSREPGYLKQSAKLLELMAAAPVIP